MIRWALLLSFSEERGDRGNTLHVADERLRGRCYLQNEEESGRALAGDVILELSV